MNDKKTEALKLALEALVKATRYGFGEFEEEKSAISSAIQHLEMAEQPAQQQEPCGWRMRHNGVWAYSFTKDAWDFIYAVSPAARKAARDNAPASKPWVGLTDEEMRDLEKQFNAERVRTSDEEYLIIYPGDYWQWQRAIEAKLREKNT